MHFFKKILCRRFTYLFLRVLVDRESLKVCRLHKSLHGLKQASIQWNLKLTSAHSCYSQSKLNYSLFTKKCDAGIVIILVYVDDLLITGSSTTLTQEAKDVLNHNFKMKDLGDLRFF